MANALIDYGVISGLPLYRALGAPGVSENAIADGFQPGREFLKRSITLSGFLPPRRRRQGDEPALVAARGAGI